MAAIAPSLAVLFTNPFDTIKVRLQLQNGKKASERIYKNSWDALSKIYYSEGVKGLQKGLSPAILREGSKNLFRIGMYDPIMSVIHDSSKGTSAPAWKRAVAGSLCGVMGAMSCNPFELVKTRLQSAVSGSSQAVGHQHGYTGVSHALTSIVKEDGIKGLYRGSLLSMSRSILGSGANLATYSLMKEHLIIQRGWADNAWLDMVSGLGSGVVSCIFMNPVDVLRTRYYNQPYKNGKGVMYSSGIQAATTILKNEGPLAFYRGFLTHFLRIGPHFCLTFVFLGILRRNLAQYYNYLDLKDTFSYFDKDLDGKLNPAEIKDALAYVLPFLSSGSSSSSTPLIQLSNQTNPSETIPSLSEQSRLFEVYTRRILEKADKDQDGQINFEEFRSMEEEIQLIYQERQKAHRIV